MDILEKRHHQRQAWNLDFLIEIEDKEDQYVWILPILKLGREMMMMTIITITMMKMNLKKNDVEDEESDDESKEVTTTRSG